MLKGKTTCEGALVDISERKYPTDIMIAKNIRQVIEDRGANAHALAPNIGMYYSNLYHFLHQKRYGRNRTLNIRQLMMIADSLKVPLERLLIP